MRISSAQAQHQLVQAMLDKQSQLTRTQQQLASGQRLLAAADDPAAAVRTLALDRALDRLEIYGRNADLAQNRLQAEESTLSAMGDLLLRARELTLQANSGAQNNGSRDAITTELSQLQAQLPAIGQSPRCTRRISVRRLPEPTSSFPARRDGCCDLYRRCRTAFPLDWGEPVAGDQRSRRTGTACRA